MFGYTRYKTEFRSATDIAEKQGKEKQKENEKEGGLGSGLDVLLAVSTSTSTSSAVLADKLFSRLVLPELELFAWLSIRRPDKTTTAAWWV